MVKEGRIVATGVNPQGVPWKEISFIEKSRQEEPRKSGSNKDDEQKN